MDIEETVNRHERSIGRIEGRLDSLATKDFVRQEVTEARRAIDAKIDKQTEDIGSRITGLSNQIDRERSWRMKVTGGASVLALVFVAISIACHHACQCRHHFGLAFFRIASLGLIMDIEDSVNRHERSIGRIEGRLDSLATKDFVRKEVNEARTAIDAKIDTKIDKQTEDIDKKIEGIGDRISDLSDKIDRERSWRMKITGGASVLALVFVAVSTLVTTLVSVGIISV